MRAARFGESQFQGWDRNSDLLMQVHNLIASLIQGLSGKKNPDMFVRHPLDKREEVLRPKTLAELSAATINNFMYG